MNEIEILGKIWEEIDKVLDYINLQARIAIKKQKRDFAWQLFTLQNSLRDITFVIDDYIRFYRKLKQIELKGEENGD